MKSASGVRQSVTIPPALAAEVRRVAKKHHLTMSPALVVLAQRGVHAEKETRRQLNSLHREFMSGQDPARKQAAGEDLIRAIFGKHVIAEDSLL